MSLSYQNDTTVNEYLYGITMSLDLMWFLLIAVSYFTVYTGTMKDAYTLTIRYENHEIWFLYRMMHSNGLYFVMVIFYCLMFLVPVILFFNHDAGNSGNIAMMSATIPVFILVPFATFLIVESDTRYNVVSTTETNESKDERMMDDRERADLLEREKMPQSWLRRQFVETIFY